LTLVGLAAHKGDSLFAAELPDRLGLVLGNETDGVSDPVAAQVERWVTLPMATGVESLNVASAAAVVAYEIVRRRSATN
jgi:23S rRNA (guanosine2251-2'-O)-methyltransferase